MNQDVSDGELNKSSVSTERLLSFLCLPTQDPNQGEEELAKCPDKGDFIAIISSSGGPIYISDYEDHFCSGLSNILQSLSASFSENPGSTVEISFNDRNVFLQEHKGMLFAICTKTKPIEVNPPFLYKRMIEYMYNGLLCVLFYANVQVAVQHYTSTHYLIGKKHHLDNLFFCITSDYEFIFEAFFIQLLSKKAHTELNRVWEGILTEGLHMVMTTSGDAIVSMACSHVFSGIAFKDLYFVIKTVKKALSSAEDEVFSMKITLPTINPEVALNLSASRLIRQTNVGLILIGERKSSESEDFEQLHEKLRAMFPANLMDYLTSSVRFAIDSSGSSNLKGVLVVHHSPVFNRIFTSMSERMIMNYRQKFLTLYSKSLYAPSYTIQTDTECLHYQRSKQLNMDIFLIFEMGQRTLVLDVDFKSNEILSALKSTIYDAGSRIVKICI